MYSSEISLSVRFTAKVQSGREKADDEKKPLKNESDHRPTRPTDMVSYRVASSQLKTFLKIPVSWTFASSPSSELDRAAFCGEYIMHGYESHDIDEQYLL